jgi:hypothetical protein
VLSLAWVVLLAAVPAEKPKLILFDLAPGAGVDQSVTGPMTEALAGELGRRGFFEVVSQRDMSTLLGLDRQKQLMGCSEESTSCISELSGALGARFVMNGTVARLGEAYQLTLTTLDSQKAQPLGRSTRLAKDLGTLQATIPWAIAEATATPMPPPPSHLLPYSLIGAGGAAIVFGGVWGMVALSNESQLSGELQAGQKGALLTQTRADYEARASAVGRNKIISLAAVGAGAALLITGLLLNPSDVPGGGAVALVPTFHGAALVGVLP